MGNKICQKGYDPDFLFNDLISEKVPFPILGVSHENDLAPVKDSDESIVNYLNFSLQLSLSRRFPFFTASNIDGNLFRKANRASSWKLDERVKGYQWGQVLYSASNSDFDKGHITKREDVQWGNTQDIAQEASDSTFFYSNAVPQHKDLNRKIWKKLENFILHKEARSKTLKVCVFTGPVLSKNDPPFVTQVKGETVLLPTLFWKVVVFPKADGNLYRVGFILSQNKLLKENGIVEELEGMAEDDELFMQFDDAATYQVNISLIETLADIEIPKAIDSYKDDRSIKLVLKEIDIDPDLECYSIEPEIEYSISNLIL